MSADADTKRGRGRPREFDEDEVLIAIQELFWERGFEASSVAEIVEAAGMNKSSLYRTFGSKEELFLRALDRYIEERAGMIDMLTGGSGGLDDVKMFVEMQRLEATSELGHRGCLAVMAATEVGSRSDAVAELIHGLRNRIRDAARIVLGRAADLGEIALAEVDTYAEAILVFNQSLVVLARSGASAAEINSQVDSIMALIDGWRIR